MPNFDRNGNTWTYSSSSPIPNQFRFGRRHLLRTASFGAIGLAGAALIGCSNGDDDGTTSSPPATTATPDPAQPTDLGTITVAIPSDAQSGDAAIAGGGSWPILEYTYDRLTLSSLDADSVGLRPALASSWEAVDGLGAEWNFTLREGVTFHNGDSFTADDVVFTYERQLDEAVRATRAGLVADSIASIEAVDSHNVLFKLNQVDVTWPDKVQGDSIVPHNYTESVGLEGFAAAPVGTGPFRLVERRINQRLIYERVADYFDSDPSNGLKFTPHVSGAELRILPESETRISALSAGEVDMIVGFPSTAVNRLSSEADLNVQFASAGQGLSLQINSLLDQAPDGQPNPYLDVRVRQAVNYAVDVDAIIQNVLTGHEERYVGVPTNLEVHDPSLTLFPYDPTEATRLLDAAGYGAGIREEDAYIFNPGTRWSQSREICDAVAGYLRDVGSQASVREMEYATVATELNQKTIYPMAFWSVTGVEYLALGATHFRGMDNPRGVYRGSSEVTELYDRALTTLDTEERNELYGRLQRIFYADDTAYLFLMTALHQYATRSPWTWPGTPTTTSGEPALWAITQEN